MGICLNSNFEKRENCETLLNHLFLKQIINKSLFLDFLYNIYESKIMVSDHISDAKINIVDEIMSNSNYNNERKIYENDTVIIKSIFSKILNEKIETNNDKVIKESDIRQTIIDSIEVFHDKDKLKYFTINNSSNIIADKKEYYSNYNININYNIINSITKHNTNNEPPDIKKLGYNIPNIINDIKKDI